MNLWLLRHYRILWIVTASVVFLLAQQSVAATLPQGFAESVFASGLSSPTTMAFAPDGRLFIAEQEGNLRVVKNGTLLSTPFLSLNVDANGERGLLGVAFDPDFTANHFVYIYYTVPSSPRHNRVSRFTANGDVALAGSEKVILDLDPLSSATNHNGGALHFAPDDTLYIAVGENANSANAQTLNTLLGKILRINPDGSIPSSNPFYASASGKNKAIWALGLRNPYTFAFQPGTGQLFINDVGEHTWEEINDGVRGKNYGWPETEGNTTDPRYKSPFYTYQHVGGACAITGGTFYNPSVRQFPSTYLNWYFFADYCAGWIKRIHPDNRTVSDFATGISSPVDLQVGPDGALYYLARGSNQVWRVIYTQGTQNEAPRITKQPASQQVTVGQAVTFSVIATGSPTLKYQWRRNNTNIPGATAASYTRSGTVLGDNGAQFNCVVTNNFGTATSNPATLTVKAVNKPPVGTITSPIAGILYRGGQLIRYSGTAKDPESGILPPSAFTWRVDFHHDTHVHPFLPTKRGVTSGTFIIPTVGETSANVWYRIHLTVTDSAGNTHSSFRDVRPRTVTLTLASNLPNVTLRLDGQPHTAPLFVRTVVGMVRTLGAAPKLTVRNANYVLRWSDGQTATHPITVPSLNTRYTATYFLQRTP